MTVTTTLPASLEGLKRALAVLQDRLAAEDPARPAVALATDQLAAFTREAVRAEEDARLAAIYTVTQALGSTLLLDDALAQVMDAAVRLTGAERATIMLFREADGDLDMRAGRNLERESLSQKEMEFSRTVVETVARTGKPVLTTNARTDPRFSDQQSVMQYNLRSILCVPLTVKDRVLGVIYADNRIRAGLFSERDLALLTAFASQAAIAIENARLYTLTDQALAARVAELESIQRVDRRLNATLDPKVAAETLLDWAIQVTRSARGCVAVQMDADSEPQLMASSGFKEGETPGLPAAPDPLAQAVSGTDLVARAATADTPAGLLAPILREGRLAGAVLVERPAEDYSVGEREALDRVTDHAATAVENTRLFQAVRRANDAKTQFVSIVSHELKVPMTSIRGYADLMRQGIAGPVSEKQTEFLRTIINNVERMAALVSDLSDISRIETGRLRIEPAAVDLGAAVRETATTMAFQFDHRKQTLQLEIPEKLPMVRTDPQRLMQILANLVSNATKYTPDGGTVTLCAKPDGRSLRVTVRDTGIGMSPDEQAKLFTQFFRGESAAVRDQPGWGLGLHVTKRLVEVLGGEIGVVSAPGKGSTFWFTQPLVEPATA